MSEPIWIAIDRSIEVPPGSVVETGYVDIHNVRFACRERMSVGDVDSAYQRRLQLGSKQPWPCPVGYWDEDVFVIQDGRHEYVAALMLGFHSILVAWVKRYENG